MSNQEKSAKKFKIEYVLVILIAISIVAILFFNLNTGQKTTQSATTYKQQLQNDLSNILSQIKGVGKISCYVSFDGDVQEVFLKNTTSVNKNDVVEIVEEVVLVNGKPYAVKNEYPTIRSILVVCEGGDDIYVKTMINNVLTMALDVPGEKIQIYKMK